MTNTTDYHFSLMPPDGHLIRSYSEEDRSDIFELMGKIHSEEIAKLSRDRWTWQYIDNPKLNASKPTMLVQVKDDKVYSLVAGIQQEFWLNGKDATGIWITDLMSSSVFIKDKNKRVSAKTLSRTFVDECDKSFDMVAGQLAMPINRYFTKMMSIGPLEFCFSHVMVRAVNVDAWVSHKLKKLPFMKGIASFLAKSISSSIFKSHEVILSVLNNYNSDWNFKQITKFDNAFDEFWDRCKNSGFKNLAVRDARYLEWRYHDIPIREYDCFKIEHKGKMVGWIVARVTQANERSVKKVRIVDALSNYEDVDSWRYLYASILDHYHQQGVVMIQALNSSSLSPLANTLAELGFKKHPKKLRMPPFIGIHGKEVISREDFYDFNGWYTTLGDSDIDCFTTF